MFNVHDSANVVPTRRNTYKVIAGLNGNGFMQIPMETIERDSAQNVAKLKLEEPSMAKPAQTAGKKL